MEVAWRVHFTTSTVIFQTQLTFNLFRNGILLRATDHLLACEPAITASRYGSFRTPVLTRILLTA